MSEFEVFLVQKNYDRCFFCAKYPKKGLYILHSELESQYDIKKIKIIKIHGQKNQGKKISGDVK